MRRYLHGSAPWRISEQHDNEYVIMKITGHSTREMFLPYDTGDGMDTKKAVDPMEGFLKLIDQNVDGLVKSHKYSRIVIPVKLVLA